MTDKERSKLLNKICELSKTADVPENQMNSVRTADGYILTITSLTERDELACSGFLKGLQDAGLSVQESHPVSIRTVYVKHSD